MVNRNFNGTRWQEIFAGSKALFALAYGRSNSVILLIAFTIRTWHGGCNTPGSRPVWENRSVG
jgi:hypothetical protein